MKKLSLVLLLALTAGCEQYDPATDEFEVETQGRNLDCGTAQVVVKDPARVARVIGSPSGGAIYLALNLDTALWVRKNQPLLLRIRRPTAEEENFPCTMMGLRYPALTVLSARVK